jgi:hypothetical protein
MKASRHTVDKPMPVFALLPGKHLLIKPANDSEESAIYPSAPRIRTVQAAFRFSTHLRGSLD